MQFSIMLSTVVNRTVQGGAIAPPPPGDPTPPDPPSNASFGVVMLGQSEYHRLLLSAHSDLGNASAVMDDAALTLYWYDLNGDGNFDAVRVDPVSNANPVNRWAIELSNTLATLAPGRRFHVCALLHAGTGLVQMLDDADPNRIFANDQATYDAFAAAYGAPDIAFMSWQNTDSTLAQGRIGDAWWAGLTGTSIEDGSVIGTGTSAYGINYSHFLSELWNTDDVPFGFVMHRYDVLDNEDQADHARFRDVRVAIDRIVANPRNQARAVPMVRGVDPVAYANPITDASHAAKGNDDGATILARMWGYNIVHMLGLGGTIRPELDQVAWSPATLTLGSSAGPLTTTRITRGQSLPAGAAKVAQLCFRPAETPEVFVDVPDTAIALTGGNIVVTASQLLSGIGSGRSPAAFLPGDRIDFAPSGAGNRGLQDFTDEAWKDYPGIAGPAGLLDIVPLTPHCSSIVSTLTLQAPPTNLLAASGSNNPANIPNGTDQGGGWYKFPSPQKLADSNQNNLDMSAFTGSATTGTFVMDCDRLEGTQATNYNTASIRARGVTASGTQQITANQIWGDVEISTLGSNQPTSFGWAPLPEGRVRLWLHFTYDAGADSRAEFHVMANVGGAYGWAGVYHGALPPETIAALDLTV